MDTAGKGADRFSSAIEPRRAKFLVKGRDSNKVGHPLKPWTLFGLCVISCILNVKITLEQATKAQRGSRGTALPFSNLGARWGWVVKATPWPLYPRETPGTHCIGGWVGHKAGLDGCEKNLTSTGIRSPDRPARSESLHRLSYTGPSILY